MISIVALAVACFFIFLSSSSNSFRSNTYNCDRHKKGRSSQGVAFSRSTFVGLMSSVM